MSRGHEGLIGRFSSPPSHNMEEIMAWLWEDFLRPSHTKKSRLLCVLNYVLLCIYMLSSHPNMFKYRYDNIITETQLW